MSAMPESRKVDTNKTQIPNQTHTPDSVCVELGMNESAREAIELVRRFHMARGHSKSRQPSPRECAQAQALIASQGGDMAQYILTFRVEARRINSIRNGDFRSCFFNTSTKQSKRSIESRVAVANLLFPNGVIHTKTGNGMNSRRFE